MPIGFFFLQLQFVLLLVTSTRSSDLGLFVCLTQRVSPRWHLTPSPHPDGCFSVSLGWSTRRLLGRGVKGWAGEREHSRASRQGSLRDMPLLLLLMPQDCGQAVLQRLSCSWASVMSLLCHCVPQLPDEVRWPQRQGSTGAVQAWGDTWSCVVVLDFLPVAAWNKVLEALGMGRTVGT